MKSFLIVLTLFVFGMDSAFALGGGSPKLPEGQEWVTGHASVRVPWGAPGCRNAVRSSVTDMQNECTLQSRDAFIVEQKPSSCHCSPTNDRNFSRCSATTRGICQL